MHCHSPGPAALHSTSRYGEAVMRILFATSEVFGLVKTGGLADVSASLPVA
ncbi:glycogen/starch synthase, partial [Thioalkalivibrio halophilus]|uniref:glycogen/starch synthase n=1 Tax=Thioalkalivibrio halophilus TaxID=252474 RepID=UPI003CC6805A